MRPLILSFLFTTLVYDLYIEDILCINLTNYFNHGSLIYFIDGRNINASFHSVIIKENFGLFIDSVYTRSLYFSYIYIESNNIRPTKEKPLTPYYVCYIESTAIMNFESFIINTAMSDRDVGGLKIHINSVVLYQQSDIMSAVNKNIAIYVNFTNCYFFNISSINSNWMDTGSAMAYHTNLPIISYFINTSFIDNNNDKGATCMEAYGQNLFQFYMINSVFLSNHAVIGSSCLTLYILYLNINGSIFMDNSLQMSETIRLRIGGALYSETNTTDIYNASFVGNKAYQGGTMYFMEENLIFLNISIVNCLFLDNQARLGGVISFSDVYNNIELNIINNTFINNQAINGGCFFFNFYSENSSIKVNQTEFLYNMALKGGVAYISIETFEIYFTENLFDSNLAWNFTYLNVLSSGGVFYMSEETSTIMISENNIYKNNTSYNSGGVYSINRGLLSDSYGSFSSDYAFNQGGSIFIRNSAQCMIFNSNFNVERTDIWGGSIFLSENANLYIYNSSFNGCISKQGGVVFLENHHNVTILFSQFSNNIAYEGGAILIYTCSNDVLISNSTFKNNPAQKYLIMMTSSTGTTNLRHINASMNNCTLFGVINSNLNLLDSYISSSDCTESTIGCILYAEESYIYISNLEAIYITVKATGSAFYTLSGKSIQFMYILLIYVIGVSTGACIQSTDSSVYMSNLSFFDIYDGCIAFLESYGQIYDSNFDNQGLYNDDSIYEDSSSFISLQSSYNFSIIRCNFSNNIAVNGAVIKSSNAQINTILYVNSSRFHNNSVGESGGAIYLVDQPFVLINNDFFNNSAKTAGALYFSNQNTNNTKELYNNIFTSNKAFMQGGALYFYDEYIDIFSNNVFLDNSADYGSNVASFPVYLRLKIYNATSTNSSIDITLIPANMTPIFDSFNESIDNLIISNYPTGIPYRIVFLLELLDHYNQTINIQNSGLGHIEAYTARTLDYTMNLYEEAYKINNLTKAYNFDDQKVTLSGDVDTFNKNGSFYFTDLTLYATPTSYINLFISNDLLINFYPRDTDRFQIINRSIGFLLTTSVRGCIAGELYIKDINYCSACPFGKYSINLKDSTCQDCPQHAICHGGSVIEIEVDYWRVKNSPQLLIYYCYMYPGACLGGIENACSIEYDGPLCSVCSQKTNNGKSYTKIGKYCVICLDDNLNALFLSGLMICFATFLFIMIRMNLKVDSKNFITTMADRGKAPNASLLYKIIIDHIQLLGINENIGFDVPDYFRVMSDVQSGSVYFLEQLFSFDCFLHFTNEKFELKSSIIFVRTASVCLLPIIINIILTLIWLIYYIVKKPILYKLISKALSSFIIAVFLLQPTILNMMSRLLSCIQIGNENYVVADMNMTCWNSEHVFMVVVFAIPCLCVWNLLFPLYCLLRIAMNRKNLKDEYTVLKFGFLYNGFDEKYFYWGFVKYFQKSIIILLRMSNLDNGVKMLTILLIWILSVSWKKFYSAYVHKILNDLEYNSNCVNLISLFLSMYLLMSVSDEAKNVIFVLILLSNIYFVILWLKSFCVLQKDLLKFTLTKLQGSFRRNLNSTNQSHSSGRVAPANRTSHFNQVKLQSLVVKETI